MNWSHKRAAVIEEDMMKVSPRKGGESGPNGCENRLVGFQVSGVWKCKGGELSMTEL